MDRYPSSPPPRDLSRDPGIPEVPGAHYGSSYEEPQAAPAAAPKRRGIWGTILAVGSFILLKAKALLLPLWAILKFAKLGKLALTSISMVLMILVYAQAGGWRFAVGFVLLILIHELGHGFAIKRAGLEAGWPVFIPFFGAMISLRGRPQNQDVEAKIAYGGPLWGGIASAVVAALGMAFASPILLSLGYTGFFLNMFNLLPMSPLDGGRIAQAFSKRAWIVGGIGLLVLFFFTHSPILLMILVLGGFRAFGQRDFQYDSELTVPQKRLWIARYFGLCVFLALGWMLTGRALSAARSDFDTTSDDEEIEPHDAVDM